MLTEKEKERIISICFKSEYKERDIQEMRSLLCKTESDDVIEFNEDLYNIEELLINEIRFQEEWNEYNSIANNIIEELFN